MDENIKNGANGGSAGSGAEAGGTKGSKGGKRGGRGGRGGHGGGSSNTAFVSAAGKTPDSAGLTPIDPKVAADIASIPMGYPIGDPMVGIPAINNPSGIILPGIMIIKWHPRIGDTMEGINSGAQLASTSLFAYLTHINSGNQRIPGVDYMMMVMNVADLYSTMAEMERVYGVSNLYSRNNRYYGRNLVQALGWDPNTFLKHAADFRTLHDQLVGRINAIPLPRGFEYITRQMWLASHIWADDATTKHQLYAFCKSHYLSWEPNKFPQYPGSTLVYKEFKSTRDDGLWDLDTFAAHMNERIEKILHDLDYPIYSKDMRHTFASTELETLPVLPVDYTVTPDYAEAMRNQINNLVVAGNPIGTTYPNNKSIVFSSYPAIIQDNEVIYSNLAYPVQDAYEAYDITGSMINFVSDEVGPQDIITATRLSCRNDYVDVEGGFKTLKGVATEAVTSIEIFKNTWHGEPYIFGVTTRVFSEDQFDSGVDYRNLCDLAKFRYAPRVYFYGSMNGTDAELTTVTGDVRNVGFLPAENLTNMSRILTIKEFTPKAVGNFSSY